ncbi:hypothetical protein JBE04_44635, partial [Streptomyces sp. PRKS01-29]
GTIVLLGTGTAAAYGHGSDRSADIPTSFNLSSFIFQSNDCDTATAAITQVGGMAPTGDITTGNTCVNSIG